MQIIEVESECTPLCCPLGYVVSQRVAGKEDLKWWVGGERRGWCHQRKAGVEDKGMEWGTKKARKTKAFGY